MNIQVKPSHYFSNDYDYKGRFISYWYQIHEIKTLGPESILEIGIGNSLVANYLKQRGLKIITLDIDKGLSPDTVGSVLSMPFSNNSFELVACFEVLEHLPYKFFPQALNEIHRVSRKNVLLSLPDVTRTYLIHLRLPKIREIKKLISFPRRKPCKHSFEGEHYWEIGKDGYPLQKVLDEILRAGFKLNHNYQVFEEPFHRFFLLTKGEAANHG